MTCHTHRFIIGTMPYSSSSSSSSLLHRPKGLLHNAVRPKGGCIHPLPPAHHHTCETCQLHGIIISFIAHSPSLSVLHRSKKLFLEVVRPSALYTSCGSCMVIHLHLMSHTCNHHVHHHASYSSVLFCCTDSKLVCYIHDMATINIISSMLLGLHTCSLSHGRSALKQWVNEVVKNSTCNAVR